MKREADGKVTTYKSRMKLLFFLMSSLTLCACDSSLPWDEARLFARKELVV